MFQAILEFIWEWIVDFFWWVILFPVVWLVSLPFILVIAVFRRRPYWLAVGNMFASVNEFWRDTAGAWAV